MGEESKIKQSAIHTPDKSKRCCRLPWSDIVPDIMICVMLVGIFVAVGLTAYYRKSLSWWESNLWAVAVTGMALLLIKLVGRKTRASDYVFGAVMISGIVYVLYRVYLLVTAYGIQ